MELPVGGAFFDFVVPPVKVPSGGQLYYSRLFLSPLIRVNLVAQLLGAPCHCTTGLLVLLSYTLLYQLTVH